MIFRTLLTIVIINFIQRGGAHSDAYINAADDNGFIGTIGSLIIGAIIWWLIITTWNSNKKD